MKTYRVIVKRYGAVIAERLVAATDSGEAANIVLDFLNSPYEKRFSVTVTEA